MITTDTKKSTFWFFVLVVSFVGFVLKP